MVPIPAISVAKARPERCSVRYCNAESHDTNVDDNCVASTNESRDGFTSKQGMFFQRRYEEGYNFYIDADYTRWLRLHHLEVNISTPTEQDSGSLLDAFRIIPISPVRTEFPEDEVNDDIHHQYLEQHLLSCSYQLILSSNCSKILLPLTGSATTSPPSMNNQTTTNVIIPSSQNSTSPLSEFLI